MWFAGFTRVSLAKLIISCRERSLRRRVGVTVNRMLYDRQRSNMSSAGSEEGKSRLWRGRSFAKQVVGALPGGEACGDSGEHQLRFVCNNFFK